jgi:hypothetical protein
MIVTQKQDADYKEQQAVAQTFQGGNFGDLLNGLIEKKLDKHERGLLSAIASDYEKALTLSRNNDIAEAGLYLNNANREQAKYPLASLMYSLLELHGLPVKAYFYYKNNEYDIAEQLLLESIQSSGSLVNDGFYMVECHRIQQMHNLARMYFKRKQFEHAGRIIAEALLYMTREKIPDTRASWNVAALRQNPMSLRTDMILQLALETIGELLPPTQQQPEIYHAVFGNWSEPLPGLAACEPLDYWIKLKNLFLSGNSDESFMEAAVDFVMTAPSRFDILKLALIVDITDLLRRTADYDAAIYTNLYAFGQRLKVSKRYKLACFAYLQP